MNPETQVHILAQPYDGKTEQFGCGCWYRKNHTISLCSYHHGYDERGDLLRPDAEEPTNE